MKRDSIQLVRSIYRANKAKEKRAYLETFLDDFELLKFEICQCVDMKILSIKKTGGIKPINGLYRKTNCRVAKCQRFKATQITKALKAEAQSKACQRVSFSQR